MSPMNNPTRHLGILPTPTPEIRTLTGVAYLGTLWNSPRPTASGGWLHPSSSGRGGAQPAGWLAGERLQLVPVLYYCVAVLRLFSTAWRHTAFLCVFVFTVVVVVVDCRLQHTCLRMAHTWSPLGNAGSALTTSNKKAANNVWALVHASRTFSFCGGLLFVAGFGKFRLPVYRVSPQLSLVWERSSAWSLFLPPNGQNVKQGLEMDYSCNLITNTRGRGN